MSDNQKKEADECFCSSCGAVIKKEAEICPKCGVRQFSLIEKKKNGFAVASLILGILSFISSITVLMNVVRAGYNGSILSVSSFLFAYLIPSCVFGGISYKKYRHKLALIGLILCGISILLIFIAGVYAHGPD